MVQRYNGTDRQWYRQTLGQTQNWQTIGHIDMGGDLAPSLGGRKIFEWPFLGKTFHFYAENFWWPFFSNRPSFVCLLPVSTVWNLMIYVTVWYIIIGLYSIITHVWPFCSRKPLFHKKFVHLTFFSHFITLLLKILGGWMHGPSPHLKFGGSVPQPLLSLRPCTQTDRVYNVNGGDTSLSSYIGTKI